MPVYEFYCDDCSCRFEQYKEVNERAAAACPECGKRARKVFQPVSIIFKGSGFHVTDYRNDKPPKEPAEQPADKPKVETPKADTAGKTS
jgi:putative FmdB family regulatory protein